QGGVGALPAHAERQTTHATLALVIRCAAELAVGQAHLAGTARPRAVRAADAIVIAAAARATRARARAHEIAQARLGRGRTRHGYAVTHAWDKRRARVLAESAGAHRIGAARHSALDGFVADCAGADAVAVAGQAAREVTRTAIVRVQAE